MNEKIHENFGLRFTAEPHPLNPGELYNSFIDNASDSDPSRLPAKSFAQISHKDCSLYISDLPVFVNAFSLSEKWLNLHPKLLGLITFSFSESDEIFSFKHNETTIYFMIPQIDRMTVLTEMFPAFKLVSMFSGENDKHKTNARNQLLNFLNELDSELQETDFIPFLKFVYQLILEMQQLILNSLFELSTQNKLLKK